MAAKTWYVTNTIVGSTHQEMSETSPGSDATSSPAYGWTVGTVASGNFSSADAGSNQGTGTFSGTAQPDGSIVTTSNAGDCWRTTNPYSGTFATGNWTFQMAVIATSGTAQRGQGRFRLFRSANADGSSATEITSGVLVGGTIGSPGSQTTSVHNGTSISSFSVTNEYLFVQIGWGITTAGSMVANNILHRVGSTASLVTSTDFTALIPQSVPATAGSTATLAFLASFFRTLSATAVGVATLVAARLYARALSASAVSVATMARGLVFARALSSSAVSVATLAKLATYARTLAATALGVGTLGRVASYARTLAATAVSVASLTADKIAGGGSTFPQALNATMVGVGSLVRALTLGRVLEVAAATVPTLARAASLARSMTATAVGVASLVAARLYPVALGATATCVASLSYTTTAAPPVVKRILGPYTWETITAVHRDWVVRRG